MSAELAERRQAGQMYCPRCAASFASGVACPDDGARLIRLLPTTDTLPGRDIDGRFTILERLGQGGMGAVYRAHQHSVDRDVAIKLIHPHLVADPDVIKRFLREARLASKLNHPNAVGVLDFGQTEDGMFYLVMELIAGRTLECELDDPRGLNADGLVKLGVQVCDALEAAHALSIVHRDLKPANIMLLDGARDFVKVLDFGLAKSLAADEVSDASISGMLHGTPAYVAPERALGLPGDARSDLYSLGCILFLLGSGALPLSARTPEDLLIKQAVEPAPPMTGVPFALARVIDRLLLKDPALRFQTAAETRAALEAALDEMPASPAYVAMGTRADPTQLSMPFARPRNRALLARSDTLPAPLPANRARRWGWVAALATLIMVIALAAAVRDVAAIARPAHARPTPSVEQEPAIEPLLGPVESPARSATPPVTATSIVPPPATTVARPPLRAPAKSTKSTKLTRAPKLPF